MRQKFQCSGKVVLRPALHLITQKHTEYIGILRFGGVHPVNDSGIANVLLVILVGQQVIERGRVGERGVLADGCVIVLFVAIGAECGCVERHERRTAGLCITHTFDRRMHGSDLIELTGDKALLFRCIGIAVIVRLPCRAQCRIICGILSVRIEHQICGGDDFIVLIGKRRMLFGLSRVPCVEKCQYRTGKRRIYAVE